ncbi:MAG: DUF3604 domain-containing protein [bacterium]|nr:DUF3604 domain-containing protein [bacterium]
MTSPNRCLRDTSLHAVITACVVFATLAAADAVAAETNRCDHYDPQKNVFWGDLHIHTAYSMDAYMFDTRLTPGDAYAFAKGEPRTLPPLGEDGTGTRPFQIGRPLDFAAITDHADALGGVHLCTTPGSKVYDSEVCRNYRRPFEPASSTEAAEDIVGRVASLNSAPLCGEDWAVCRQGTIDAWQDMQTAAAKHDDPTSACNFTTFIAYEHTATPEMTKIHRNVIFRNEHVIESPIRYSDEPTGPGLWKELDRQCIQGKPGCDVLAIPHNPNLSNGRLFTIEYPEGTAKPEQARLASLRARMEPVVEMMQIKGESECKANPWKVLGADEDCGFEKYRQLHQAPDCEGRMEKGALAGQGCSSRLDYARYALIEGLREADRIGVNPYAFGMIGATDIHTGTPGATDEWETDSFDSAVPGPGYNLGGLAAVWAEENSRDAIFDALRRREVYATSGSRMTVRLFGGWDYPENLCDAANLVEQGYAGGVPMGGDLPARPGKDEAPTFVVSAMQDAGTEAHPGNLLQRVQIVKGWADPDGTFHQQVVDVAGRKDNGASVDTKTCEVSGPGERQLCSVWTDPDFDPNQRAVYYARVFENPSCRFSTRICAKTPERDVCKVSSVPKTVQDRAWTSPIWYTP